jgi:hypothetical protein
MSRNGKAGQASADGWLEGDQRRAWLAYIRVQLRLAYEMNRQLLADSGLSLPDYDVLTALSVADGGRMPITVLAAHIGWASLSAPWILVYPQRFCRQRAAR